MMRVVITTRILPVALGFDAVLREMGHEPVGLLTMRDTGNRYGSAFTLDALLAGLPEDLDVVIPARRSEIAPLLASMRPDLVVCMGFPWRIPPDALALPAHGWLNGHPSLLPLHRGPIPIAWAIRHGDEETGITFHKMDADLDTGPILVQKRYPIGEYTDPDEFYGRTGAVVMSAFAEALEKIDAGEGGTPQPAGGEYETFFGEADARLDPSLPATELHRLVWAWRYAVSLDGVQGAFVDLGGQTVRVLASSLSEVEDAPRLECADGPLWLVRTEPVQEPARAAAARS
jgi:methionyl-tRNA formyltransferase